MRDLAIDSITGDMVVAGSIASADFPGTAGGAQSVWAGSNEGFIARLSSDLKTLRQSTYLGGDWDDDVFSIAIDPATGDVLVAGETMSANFPGTTGGTQPALIGDRSGFLARLSGDLKTLRQSTYLGGGSDSFQALAIDEATGDVLVGGITYATDFPGAVGGAQSAHSNGNGLDGVVARLSGDLKTLRQSTYLGGQGVEWTTSLAIDAATGDVLVAGPTGSTDFPGTAGGAQPGNGGGRDTYVARLSGDLKILRQSTYMGGQGSEGWFVSLVIDAARGEVVVATVTDSTDFPGTAGGVQSALAGSQNGIVARLSGDLKTLRQSTYLGGLAKMPSWAW